MRRLTLLLALSLAAPALAWDLRTDSEGDVVRWAKPVVMTLASTAADQLKDRDAPAAIEAAVQGLDDATPFLDVSLQSGDAKPIGYVVGATDNTNSIIVLDTWPYAEGTLAVTLVTLNARTNELLDADVAFNAEDHDFKVLSNGALRVDLNHFDDVQNTVTHELGHVLGLMHSKAAEDVVMYPSAPPGETCKRDLKQDDRDGLLSLYGTAPLAPVASTPEPAASPLPAFGCSATSSTSPFAALLVLGALLLLRGRRTVAAAAVVALPLTALAQDLPSLPKSVLKAEQVSVVEVTARRSAWHPKNPGLIVTELTVQPVECLKGACAPPQVIVVAGGRVGDIEQVAMHEPVPQVGDRMLALHAGGRTRMLWSKPEERQQIVQALRLQLKAPLPPSPATP